jgi:hypothetical protein
MTHELDPLLGCAGRSMRRVLKATWAGTAKPGADYYCAELECGHHTHVTEPVLKSPLMCMECVKKEISEVMPK